MIEVKHLTKRYGTADVVHDLNFTIESGKIYGFLGPNGAGKSTTMNMITGCLAMTEGDVLINGHDIVAEPAEAKRFIGYLPEQPPLYTDMTPLEYLTFVAKAKGIEKGHISDQVAAVMEETHITSMKDRMIRNLSKGYKQRVGIAQAMLGNPQLIILDEPTVGLDPKQIMEIRDLILELGKTRTVLLSSHILAEISAVCDHVMILSHGRLVANGTLEQIRRAHAGENILTLEVRGQEDNIKEILSSLKNISEFEMIETEKKHYRIRITVNGDRDIREQVFFAFADAKCPILSMQSSAMTLEDVFLKLTSDDAAVPEAEDAEFDDTDAEDENSTDTIEGSEPQTELPEEKITQKAEKKSDRRSARKASKPDKDEYVPMFGAAAQDQSEEEDDE